MKLPLITEVTDLKGKRVLMRVDFNVPVKDGVVTDDFRIRKVLPTIQFLQNAGAKIILLSHIGREKTDSLLPASVVLEKSVHHTFVSNFETFNTTQMSDGEVVLCENLRKWDGEKASDETFAEKLAKLGDIYVNEAFPVSHREDTSVFLLPKLLPAYFGPLFNDEFENLSLAFNAPRPFFVMVCGAKFETKLPLVTKFMELADNVFVGGALANDFFKLKGYEVGKSLVDDDVSVVAPLLESQKLLLPIDVVIEDKTTKRPEEIQPDDKIMDGGNETIKMLEKNISEAQLILWNGPLGSYENGFDAATIAVARAVEKSAAHVIVGGGDTVAAIQKCNIDNKTTFISTAGGAMLDFLANGTLPGIEAILSNNK